MTLKIDQTWAQIGLKTNLPQVKLQIREPQLKVIQELPRVQIRQEPAQVKCDASQCWSDMGLYTPLEAGRFLARKGMQESTAYTGQVAQDGDFIADFHKNDISAVMAYLGDQAFEDLDYNVTCIPKSPVEIEVVPGDLDLNWKLGKVRLEPRFGDVNLHLAWGKVNVYMLRQPSIKIEYLGENVDMYW